nr:hypothetical protein [Klebsiella pneumoniae]
MRNRLINDATSLQSNRRGSHATGWLFSGGRNIDSLLNQQLLTHMAAGQKPDGIH